MEEEEGKGEQPSIGIKNTKYREESIAKSWDHIVILHMIGLMTNLGLQRQRKGSVNYDASVQGERQSSSSSSSMVQNQRL